MTFYTLPGIPSDMLTSGNFRTRRFRVEPGQTGFFEGREFQTFKEFSLAGQASLTIKAQSLVPVILQRFEIDVFTESVRVEWREGGTETAEFTDPLPVFRTNETKAFPYQSQITLTANGTQTGGTLLDVLEIGTGQKGVSAINVGNSLLGFAAGVWYIRIKNLTNQTARGAFKARWEERP